MQTLNSSKKKHMIEKEETSPTSFDEFSEKEDGN